MGVNVETKTEGLTECLSKEPLEPQIPLLASATWMATPTPVDIWGFILWRGLCTAGNQAQMRTGLSTKTRKFNDNLQKTENPDESSLLRSRQKIKWTTSPKGNPERS